ncbi:AAA domain-containing protein [Heliobacterium undosum]|uniref:AAA domain-containing protein n=2 Tax=Heliomicrobium undosum TaxID=121734 RepID=A0A845L6T3_9FIRM|nr:AAA domain-containing protein [Heliomicrobium undosum]
MDYLAKRFLERESVIKAAMVAFVARKNLLLIGPPGTAKSELVSSLAELLNGCNYFQWLLSKFTTPEELFGPVSLRSLEQDAYRRITTAKLPEAHVAFLDEVFKASSAILNALLTLMNERLFYNNGAPVRTPLVSVIGASNEFPEEGENLSALFDRFHLRFELSYLGDGAFLDMLNGAATGWGITAYRPQLSLADLEALQAAGDRATVPIATLNTLREIRRELVKEGITPSDRRFVNGLALLKAHAVLDGRDQVMDEDLSILAHSLWEEPEQKAKVGTILRQFGDKFTGQLEELVLDAKEVAEKALANPEEVSETSKAIAKLKKIGRRLVDMEPDAGTKRKQTALRENFELVRQLHRTVHKMAFHVEADFDFNLTK